MTYHAIEIRGLNIEENATITFDFNRNGKREKNSASLFSSFQIPKSTKSKYVNLHKLKTHFQTHNSLNYKDEFTIGVSRTGKPTKLSLNPVTHFFQYSRMTFEEIPGVQGRELVIWGLPEEPRDQFLKIRIVTPFSRKIYDAREKARGNRGDEIARVWIPTTEETSNDRAGPSRELIIDLPSSINKVADMSNNNDIDEQVYKNRNKVFAFIDPQAIQGVNNIREHLITQLGEFKDCKMIHLDGPGRFSFEFTNEESKTAVLLQHHKVFINEKPLQMIQWSEAFDYSKCR